jgi:peptidoglycan/xylan/chitin deacetylase (PgdA/CDA1 family)
MSNLLPRRTFLPMIGLSTLLMALPKLARALAQPATVAPFDVYMTFDDGPTSNKDFKTGPTDRTLQILKDKNASSTFFLHGRAINDWEGPTLVRYLADGHAIGNHLWRQGGNTVQDNPSWALMARQYLEAEVRIRTVLENTDNGAYQAYLKGPKLFRRPGGNNGLNDFLNPKNLPTIRTEPYMRPALTYIDWLTSVYDYSGWHINGGESIPPAIRPLTADAEEQFILHGGGGYYGVLDFLNPNRSADTDAGLIILMHDASEITVGMLPKLIDTLRGMGANFRALPRPSDSPNTKTVGIGYAPAPPAPALSVAEPS